MTHLIGQQYLHIEFDGSETEGLALQRRLSALCYQRLLPAIELVLDRHSPREGTICIDRLELDAGALNVERLEQELAESVAQALDRSLREEFAKPRPAARQMTLQQTIEKAFLHFLETGTLPWSFRLPVGTGLEQALVFSWQEKGRSENLHDPLLRMLASPTVRTRLIRQFSTSFLGTMLALFSPQGLHTVTGILETFRSLLAPSPVREHFRRRIWEAAFAGVVQGKILSEEYFVIQARSPHPTLTASDSGKTVESETRRPAADGKATGSDDSARGTLQKTPRAFALLEQSAASEEGSENGSEHPDQRTGIYVENAGLVLLHPFLPRFFEALEIASQDQLLQPERALCLLHYLGTGQSVAPEYRMMLPKILCNVALQTPIESDVDLTTGEQEEASALLAAVIGHWDALRNTSADGLRGTFLTRQGKLSIRPDGDWLLQVESQTCDILLGQLPWGISMIQLPWMDRMLWAEWR